MMETQFTGGELIKQRVRIKAGVMGYLPHPFGSAFELSESCLSLRNLVVPCRVGLFSCGPGGAFLLDCSKFGGLTVDCTLEAGLKDVDLVVRAQNLDDPANAGVIVGDDIRVSLLKHFCPSLESPVLEF